MKQPTLGSVAAEAESLADAVRMRDAGSTYSQDDLSFLFARVVELAELVVTEAESLAVVVAPHEEKVGRDGCTE